MTIRPSKKSVDEKPRTYRTYGDCLEARGIPNPAYVVVDRTLIPKISDLVHCTRFPRTINSYIKEVREVGDDIIVGTRYLDSNRDYTFAAAELLGTVIVAKDSEGNVVYRRKKRGGLTWHSITPALSAVRI